MQNETFAPYFDLDLDAEQEITFVNCTTGQVTRYPTQRAMVEDLNPGLIATYQTPADLIRDIYTDAVSDYDDVTEMIRDLVP